MGSRTEHPAQNGPASLKGRRIVVTRAPEQAEQLVNKLKREGAEVLLLPAVRFSSITDTTAVDAAIEKISGFDWILFTSPNAVRFFCARFEALGFNPDSSLRAKTHRISIATIGPATRDAAIQQGISVDYTATNHTGKGLADEMRERLHDKHVLLPRSDRADDRLPLALRKSGAQVSEIIVYRTVTPETYDPGSIAAIRKCEVDAVVFASPSAFRNLSDEIGAQAFAEISCRIAFAAIGDTTGRAIRDAGARCSIEAADASDEALTDALVKHYKDSAPAKIPAARRA